MRRINYYGEILTDKHFILPDENDPLAMPIIKTPCVLTSRDEIPLTFCTQEDAKVDVCPECGCDVLTSTLSYDADINIAHWHCLRGHDFETRRGITLVTQLQLL